MHFQQSLVTHLGNFSLVIWIYILASIVEKWSKKQKLMDKKDTSELVVISSDDDNT